MRTCLTILIQLIALHNSWSHHHRCGSKPVIKQIIQPGIHSEGPHWDVETQVLYYVDIEAGRLNRYDPVTGVITHAELPGRLVAIAIPVEDSGARRFLVASGHDLLLLDWNNEDAVFDSTTNSDNITVITSVETEPGFEGNSWNDGKADARGRFWGGTIGPSVGGKVVQNQCAVYMLDINSTEAIVVEKPVSVSNGIAWNEDNTLMYYADSATAQVDVFDFDLERGLISNRRKVFNMVENNLPGHPDGLTIDNNGNLWVASFFGGLVVNIDPRNGTFIRSLEFPTSRVTSVIFGGPDFDILYVTTSRFGLTDGELAEQPASGSVYSVMCLGVTALAPGHNIVRD